MSWDNLSDSTVCATWKIAKDDGEQTRDGNQPQHPKEVETGGRVQIEVVDRQDEQRVVHACTPEDVLGQGLERVRKPSIQREPCLLDAHHLDCVGVRIEMPFAIPQVAVPGQRHVCLQPL